MKSKKWVYLILTTAVSAGLVTGCGDGDAGSGNKNSSAPAGNDKVSATGFPIVKEPIKLTMMAGKAPTTANNWNETMLWQEYAKMTNIHVDFQLVPFDALTEKRNLMMAGGDYPDAVYLGRFNTDDLMKYGSQGALIKLNDLIDKHAPNFKKIMDQNPEVKKAITMPDGNIYSFPNMLSPDFPSVRMGAKLWLKKEWLDALGMKEPNTTEEFYNYLKAVKNTDLNKNGKQDEVPLSAPKLKDIFLHFKGYFGLQNRGSSHSFVDMGENNQLRFIPTDDRYKEQLTYFNKLWSEGLIDKDILVNEKDQNKFFAKGAEGVFGAIRVSSPFTLMKQTGYFGAPSLAGPRGDKLHSEFRPAVANPGAFVITNKNKNPEATVRWMDYFFSEEGNKLFFMGFKDKSYIEKPDGNVEYTDEINKNPQGLTFEQALVKYVTWPGGGYPGIVREKYFKGAESLPESLEAAKKVAAELPKEVWPAFSYTDKETDRMQALNTDITAYVDEMTTKFITGAVPLSDWNKFVDTIKKMGLDEYLKIYQAAYDRYKK